MNRDDQHIEGIFAHLKVQKPVASLSEVSDRFVESTANIPVVNKRVWSLRFFINSFLILFSMTSIIVALWLWGSASSVHQSTNPVLSNDSLPNKVHSDSTQDFNSALSEDPIKPEEPNLLTVPVNRLEKEPEIEEEQLLYHFAPDTSDVVYHQVTSRLIPPIKQRAIQTKKDSLKRIIWKLNEHSPEEEIELMVRIFEKAGVKVAGAYSFRKSVWSSVKDMHFLWLKFEIPEIAKKQETSLTLDKGDEFELEFSISLNGKGRATDINKKLILNTPDSDRILNGPVIASSKLKVLRPSQDTTFDPNRGLHSICQALIGQFTITESTTTEDLEKIARLAEKEGIDFHYDVKYRSSSFLGKRRIDKLSMQATIRGTQISNRVQIDTRDAVRPGFEFRYGWLIKGDLKAVSSNIEILMYDE